MEQARHARASAFTVPQMAQCVVAHGLRPTLDLRRIHGRTPWSARPSGWFPKIVAQKRLSRSPAGGTGLAVCAPVTGAVAEPWRLLLQGEADFEGDLIALHLVALDAAANLLDLPPAELTQRLPGFGD